MRIETKRLALRDFVEDDWRRMFEYQRDPRYLEYYAWTERTEDDVRSFAKMLLDLQFEQPRRKFQLAVELRGQMIGNCGIRRKPDNAWEADIGYELSPDHWGHGYATEAARAVVDFGFRELGLHRVSSWINADNARSARVLQKVGLKEEGRFRETDYFKGRWWDTLHFGLLEPEWRDLAGKRE